MYADPAHIRDNVVKVRLNDPEMRLLASAAEFNRSQLAAFARELIIEQLRYTTDEQQGDTNGQPRLPQPAPDQGGQPRLKRVQPGLSAADAATLLLREALRRRYMRARRAGRVVDLKALERAIEQS